MKATRILSSFLLLASFAHAQKEHALPKELPPYGPVAPLKAPEVKSFQLDNGLTVWLVARGGFPKVAITMAVRGGLASDPKERPGMSEVLAKALTQGTRTRSARQVAEELQAAGGDLSVDPEQDDLLLSISVLADKFQYALPVLADVAMNANFADGEVKIAKSNVSDSLRSREAEPRFLAARAMGRIMFGDHPYSVAAPTQASIEQTTPEDLRREFSRRFEPKQGLLVIVGSFDPIQTEAALRQSFQAWKSTPNAVVPETPKPEVKLTRRIYVVPRPGSVQTTLRVGYEGPLRQASDYDATQVANAIYGGMFGSRLVLNIREDKGYTYSPFAAIHAYQKAGYMFTHADVRNAVTGATLNEINYEMNRMATTTPSDTELTQAKRYLVGNEAIGLQSNAGLAGELGRLWVDGLPPEELARQSEKIEKATAADVTAAARKYLPAAHSVIVAVGEEKVVLDEFEPFGLEIKPVP